MLLFLKLVLAPALVGGVTLCARRWGPRIGGFLTALPVIAGPTLCFYAIEQGRGFAARAAQASLLGLIGLACFSIVYAFTCSRMKWPLSLLLGWLASLAMTFALYWVPANPGLNLVLALSSFYLGRRLLPSMGPALRIGSKPAGDILLRMLAAVVLVLGLTTLASRLGPDLSGFLTPFPIAAAIIAVFTHVRQGPDAVVTYFHGFLLALNCFAVFCFMLAISLQPLGIPLAIAAALSVQLVFQGILLMQISGQPK